MWANFDLGNPRALIRPVLISLACSFAVLLLLLSITTPDRAPKWRVFLSFAGFVVAIAWISTIANEVVGVLKALGAILNISDAILGLTIFAVGNSLGDLVADITVARLGFPVMALSACFGGPMLNILLGIGLGGCYMTIQHAETKHDKHPDRPIHFKPYHLDISSSLIVSGATLLVTLLGLLVMVPLRKWRMDRVVGCSLVTVWVVSTIGNVVGEILGWGDDNIN
ncbi:putative sodium calcium exchanger protein [Diplodia seriata]|uniref:Putative sodium calcium exchanger protein n=1 Tax=Diplodia seriata TaxID=420778 RepID=A0A0G2H6C7_9PEZI|nr:putative sodium calcium exchanger protein [Diplodia seriata]